MTIQKKYRIIFITNLLFVISFIILVPFFAIKYFTPTEYKDTSLICQSSFHKELYGKLTTLEIPPFKSDERIVMIYSLNRGLIYSFENIPPHEIEIITENLPKFSRFKYRTEPFSFNDDSGVFVVTINKKNFVAHIRIYIVPILVSAIFIFVIIPALVNFKLLYNLKNSLNNLEKAAKQVSIGDYSQRLERNNEDELFSFYQAFNEMNKKLENNRDQKSRLLMSISHDLKTPLTSMKGYIEAFRDGMVTHDNTDKYIEIIWKKSDLLEERINTLIDYSKIETNEWKNKFEKIEINQLLSELTPIFKEDCLIYNRFFIYENSLATELFIRGDKKLLIRVIENILENAKRYTESNDSISLKCYKNDNNINISIKDNGIGISKNDLNYIFEPFYKSDKGRNSKGMGMGLYTVKSIISNHEGSIYCNSELGKGTEFIITLPLSKV
ncbi:MAG: HAMP domain-containing histidine kinase [Spirochaetales bacterium]|nr:HAMP domain-containing histidine kinase [Spirochaetales bacterium]